MILCSVLESRKHKADLAQCKSPCMGLGYRKLIRRKTYLYWERPHWALISAVCRTIVLRTWGPGCFTEINCWIWRQLGGQNPDNLHVEFQDLNSQESKFRELFFLAPICTSSLPWFFRFLLMGTESPLPSMHWQVGPGPVTGLATPFFLVRSSSGVQSGRTAAQPCSNHPLHFWLHPEQLQEYIHTYQEAENRIP